MKNKFRRFLYWFGLCPECDTRITHHLDEPFSSCNCGTGEDTGKPPVWQRIHIWWNRRTVRKNTYYIVEELSQGSWHTTAPSTSRYTLERAKELLAEYKEDRIGMDGVEDFRMCEVEETIRPIA